MRKQENEQVEKTGMTLLNEVINETQQSTSESLYHDTLRGGEACDHNILIGNHNKSLGDFYLSKSLKEILGDQLEKDSFQKKIDTFVNELTDSSDDEKKKKHQNNLQKWIDQPLNIDELTEDEIKAHINFLSTVLTSHKKAKNIFIEWLSEANGASEETLQKILTNNPYNMAWQDLPRYFCDNLLDSFAQQDNITSERIYNLNKAARDALALSNAGHIKVTYSIRNDALYIVIDSILSPENAAKPITATHTLKVTNQGIMLEGIPTFSSPTLNAFLQSQHPEDEYLLQLRFIEELTESVANENDSKKILEFFSIPAILERLKEQGNFLTGNKIIKLAELSKALKLPLNLSNTDLSTLDLTGINLSGANLSGANLSGATFKETTISESTQLKDTLLDKTLDPNFSINYQFNNGITLAIDHEKAQSIINGIKHTYYITTGKVDSLLTHNNLLAALQEMQTNPKSEIAQATRKALLFEYRETLKKDQHKVTMTELKAFLALADQYGLISETLCDELHYANEDVATEAKAATHKQVKLEINEIIAVIDHALESQKENSQSIWQQADAKKIELSANSTPKSQNIEVNKPSAETSSEQSMETKLTHSDGDGDDLAARLLQNNQDHSDNNTNPDEQSYTPPHNNNDNDEFIDIDEGEIKEADRAAEDEKNNSFRCRYFYDENEKHLTIVYTDPKAMDTAQQDERARLSRFERTSLGIAQSYEVVKTIHVIPEMGYGRLGKHNQESLHARMRIITESTASTFKDTYTDKEKNKLIDPRDFGLSAQSIFNDTDCARYVCAMSIQAAGLARDQLPITKENLNASPVVARAHHFKSAEDLTTALKSTYVKPLSKRASPGEIITHNIAKIVSLLAVYEARKAHKDRAYHNPFSAVFGGFSASEKYNAANNALHILNAAKEGKKIDIVALKKLKDENKALTQGELGKCISAIIEADKNTARYESKGRLGL